MLAIFETMSSKVRHQGLSKRQLGYLLLMPAILLIGFVSVYPFFLTIWYSFHKILLNVPTSGRPFVGFDNYLKLFGTSRFISSLVTTALFSFIWVTTQFVAGMLIALILNLDFKGRAFVRASVLVPWSMAFVITGLLWKWMYNPVFGFINALLMSLGIISQQINWLGTTTFAASISVLIVELWRNTPFMALILLAGLQGIPAELYEAARIDGAGRISCFRHVTLPQLRHAMLVALLFRSIDAFRSFDILFVLTRGGPGTTTEILSLHAYKTLFQYFDFGKGSAITVVMAIITTALSIMYIRLLSEKAEKKEVAS
ncbi:carbohydrate ABC transporter membrane protein 1, CUT1 family [Candidatus Moduliflexus flocculans]|uniref:Carbohydrate ABC transporter membrane protein 1, CUT1 family n=1 Tax=Candidatus Moduliflexus flocculans TaxID=1499966 RepID=A0A0S6VTC3_9BACT|nr:carbohydrate ABC transporter membrane protein 1, CUT1 family [Candidatus Moduliflexus flocculans]